MVKKNNHVHFFLKCPCSDNNNTALVKQISCLILPYSLQIPKTSTQNLKKIFFDQEGGQNARPQNDIPYIYCRGQNGDMVKITTPILLGSILTPILLGLSCESIMTEAKFNIKTLKDTLYDD